MDFELLCDSKGTIIKDFILLKPKIFGDERGFFFESWNNRNWQDLLQKNGQNPVNFVQDNHSRSTQGVLRGLHYQLPPHPQGKLVRCAFGEIFDVAVDLRRSSKTYGQWAGAKLSSDNHHQLWIPEGFAHGFLTISKHADVLYKTSDFWSKGLERSIHWSDSDIGIQWPELFENEHIISPKLSNKDELALNLCDLNIEDIFD